MNVQKVIFCGSRAVQPGQKLNSYGIKEMNGVRSGMMLNRKPFHVTAQVKYPAAKNIPLPNNIEAIMSIEIGQFSPQRTRDLSGPVIYSRSHDTFQSGTHPVFSKTFNQFLESYDCKGAVSLNSSMQSNVPDPFQWKGNCMYLNMPGGQWEQGNKLISEDMQKTHYLYNINKKKQGIRQFHTLSNNFYNQSYKENNKYIISRTLANAEKPIVTQSNIDEIKPEIIETKISNETETLSRKEKLKRAVKEYGSTVIIFHVGISLFSLGACYTLVSSGLDMETLLKYIPWIDASSSTITKNAGTFVTAYAIHKIFAPVRISITLSAVPFIVRYLRKIGFLKKR